MYNGQRESIFEEVKKMSERLRQDDKGPTIAKHDVYAMRMITLALVGIGEELGRTNKYLEKIAMDLEIERRRK